MFRDALGVERPGLGDGLGLALIRLSHVAQEGSST